MNRLGPTWAEVTGTLRLVGKTTVIGREYPKGRSARPLHPAESFCVAQVKCPGLGYYRKECFPTESATGSQLPSRDHVEGSLHWISSAQGIALEKMDWFHSTWLE